MKHSNKITLGILQGIVIIILICLMSFVYISTISFDVNYNIITPSQLSSFLNNDTTNYNMYSEKYKCKQFSEDLISNAEKYNYKVGFVSLNGKEKGHAIVVFKTTEGLIYVEPQRDVAFNQSYMNEMLKEERYNIADIETDFNFSVYKITWNYFHTTQCYYILIILLIIFIGTCFSILVNAIFTIYLIKKKDKV